MKKKKRQNRPKKKKKKRKRKNPTQLVIRARGGGGTWEMNKQHKRKKKNLRGKNPIRWGKTPGEGVPPQTKGGGGGQTGIGNSKHQKNNQTKSGGGKLQEKRGKTVGETTKWNANLKKKKTSPKGGFKQKKSRKERGENAGEVGPKRTTGSEHGGWGSQGTKSKIKRMFG